MAAIKPQILTVKLDDYLPHYPGETAQLRTNLPQGLMDEFWKLVGSENIASFFGSHVILAHSFTSEDGGPLPVKDIPWDVFSVLRSALVTRFTEMFEAINKAFDKPAAK